MDTNSSILLLILLLLLSAFFSGAEIALVSLSPAKVRTMVETKKKFAGMIASLKKHPDKLLITILIGSNLMNTSASVMATTVTQKLFGDHILAYVVGVMTLLILIFTDIVPKTLSLRFNVLVAQMSAPILWFLGIILFPVIYVLEIIIKFFIWITGQKKFKSVTEDEIIAMLDIGHEEGEFAKEESEFIQNIFEFHDTTAEEIMVNRNEIEAFPGDITLEKATKLINKSSHTRIPVYQGSIDSIIGYTTLKDLLKFSRRASNHNKKLEDLNLHKILFFPVTKPINKIFKTFQQKRIHISIILDEFGSTAGMVSLEDVLEEIVGDIVDEKDQEEISIKKLSKNTYQLEANTTLEEILELHPFTTTIPTHKTVAFLIIKYLGAFPREGEKVVLDKEGLEFVVEKMDDKTIQRVRMIVKNKSTQKAD